jgi:hypothetical protein
LCRWKNRQTAVRLPGILSSRLNVRSGVQVTLPSAD